MGPAKIEIHVEAEREIHFDIQTFFSVLLYLQLSKRAAKLENRLVETNCLGGGFILILLKLLLTAIITVVSNT